MSCKGRYYEQRAADYLRARGLSTLMQNYRSKTGEIDLIAREGDTVVFVEVRARGNRRFHGAAASVDRRKQGRLLRTAQCFLQQHPALAQCPCRFDVVAFEPPQSGTELRIHWIRGAFTM